MLLSYNKNLLLVKQLWKVQIHLLFTDKCMVINHFFNKMLNDIY